MISCNENYPDPELDVVLTAYRLDYARRMQPEECPFFIYTERSTDRHRMNSLLSHVADSQSPVYESDLMEVRHINDMCRHRVLLCLSCGILWVLESWYG